MNLFSISSMFLSTWVLSFLLVSCSEGPEQYQREKPNKSQEKFFTYDDSLEDLKKVEEVISNSEKDDLLVRKNSSQPILYKVGAAGISFDTTVDEAELLLSEPLNFRSDGFAAYREGVYVVWRNQDPRIPSVMYIVDGYLGKIDLGEKVGSLSLGQDLSSFYQGGDKLGEQLFRDIYNHLEGKDDSFDCLAQKVCEIKKTENNILYIMPKIVFLVGGDRKALIQVRLVNGQEPGNLIFDFDFFEQSIDFKNKNGQRKSIKMNQYWSDAEKMIAGDSLISVNQDNFAIQHDQVNVYLTKGDSVRSYVTPQNDERIQAFLHFGSYEGLFKVKEDYVSYSYSQNESDFIFKKQLERPGEEGSSQFLSMKTTLLTPSQKGTVGLDRKSLQRKFFFTLNDFLEKELTTESNKQTVSRSSGLEDLAFESSISHFIMNYDENKGTAKFIEYAISNSTGNFSYFYSAFFQNAFNRLIFPQIKKDIEAEKKVKIKSLLGFELGEMVRLTEKDLGREEATAILEKNGEKLIARVNYDDQFSWKMIYSKNGRQSHESHEVISVGDLTVNLFLAPVKDKKGSSSSKYKIIGIGSSNLFGEIKRLCGLKSMSIKIGQKAKEVETDLNTLIQKQKIADKDFDCNKFETLRTDGSGELSSITFPEQRIKLFFNEKQLSSVMVYAHKNEVMK